MEDFFYAGGLPAVLRNLLPLLHDRARSVNGKSLGDNVRDAVCHDPDVIRPLDMPLAPEGGTVILFGNLCPDGAVLKQSAASAHLLTHRGRAVVFEDSLDLERRIDDPVAAHRRVERARPQAVRAQGRARHARSRRRAHSRAAPQGGREGHGAHLGRADERHLLRHRDPARGAGVRGGRPPRPGPRRRRDRAGRAAPPPVARSLPDEELARRRAAWRPRPDGVTGGYLRLYLDHVLQADQGVDFDILRGCRPVLDEETARGFRLA